MCSFRRIAPSAPRSSVPRQRSRLLHSACSRAAGQIHQRERAGLGARQRAAAAAGARSLRLVRRPLASPVKPRLAAAVAAAPVRCWVVERAAQPRVVARKAEPAQAAQAQEQAGAAHTRDHCLEGYDPDPSDSSTTMKDGPVDFTKSNQVDTTIQPEVLDWFKARVWEQAHFQWHNIRRCTSGAATDDKQGGGVNPCKTNPELIPANQENKGPGDGLEFLAMHRHMIQSLKQLWPKHAEQFEGWDHFSNQGRRCAERVAGGLVGLAGGYRDGRRESRRPREPHERNGLRERGRVWPMDSEHQWLARRFALQVGAHQQ